MRGVACSLAVLLSTTALTSAIDFAPRYAESVQDGFPVRRLYFAEKEQRIYLAIPQDWSVSGNGSRASLLPPSHFQALVTLENSASAEVPFDEKGLEFYRKTCTAAVPPGAVNVQVASETINGLPINGWTSFEMAFTYQLFGQNFEKSIMFITLGKDQQIQMRVESRQEHFENIYGRSRGILGSWFAPPPELEAVLANMTKRH